MNFGENFKINETDGKVTLTKYERSDAAVVVPEGITEIGKSAFYNNSTVESISLPNGIVNIGDFAFRACTNLKQINLPVSVKQIGDAAFYETRIEEIIIPDGITSIRDRTFYNCTYLKKITFPDSLESIGESAFSDCKSLNDLSLPNRIKNVAAGAFFRCTSLRNVRVPDGLHIQNAFADCKSLPVVDGFQIAGNCIVKNYQDKSLVEIPENITEVGIRSFADNNILENIVFNNKIENIGISAFYDCIKLNNIDLPISIRSISKDAFTGCSNLKKIHWPDCDIECDGAIFKKCAPDLEISFKFCKGGKIPPDIIKYLNKEKLTNTDLAYLISFQGAKKWIDYTATLISQNNADGIYQIIETDIINSSMMDNKKISILAKAYERHKNLISEELAERIKKSLNAALGNKTVKIESADTAALKNLWRTQKAADGTLMLLSYKGTENIVQVPSQIGGVNVSVLGKEGTIFKGFTNSQTIILPAEVAMSEVFRKTQRIKVEIDAKHLLYQQNGNLIISRDGTEVVYCNPSDEITLSIPEGVTCFNARVPSQTENIEFPLTLGVINGYLGSSKVKNIVIPENVKKINLDFFLNASCLESITTKAVISESQGVWTYNGVLRKIEIPESDFYHQIMGACDKAFIHSDYNVNLFSLMHENHTKFEFLCLEFKRLINTWIKCEDKIGYNYPEVSEDADFNGCLENKNAKEILPEYVKFVCKESNANSNKNLFGWDEERLQKYLTDAIDGNINIHVGGLDAATALIALTEIYGHIEDCSVSFTHDKWEARGEYSTSGRKSYILQDNGFVKVELKPYEAWSN